MQDFTLLANRLADEAGEIVRRYFRTPFEVERKGDDTPVTIADRAVEQRLRQIIEAERPEDGIIGEEFGIREGASGYVWVLDPIDGTKSFTIGRPSFGTLIGLWRRMEEKDDRPVLGIIDQPVLRERWVGVTGQKTTFNGAPVQTRPCPRLKDASVASTSPAQLPELWKDLYAMCGTVVWGGDCYSYGLLSNGWLDIVIEAGLSVYDYAALVPVVEGAGGMMCGWDGKPLTLKSDGRTIALGHKILWPQIETRLAGG